MSSTDAAATTPKPPARWDAIGAVIAAPIGLLALAVSWYTAMLQRDRLRAEVWPTRDHHRGGQPSHHRREHGRGPSPGRGLRIYVDGQPRRSWPVVFDALGLSDLQITRATTINGIVVVPEEAIQQVGFDEAADFQRVFDQYPRLSMALCHCSTLGDWWLLDERERPAEHRRRLVGASPRAVRTSSSRSRWRRRKGRHRNRSPPRPPGRTGATAPSRHHHHPNEEPA